MTKRMFFWIVIIFIFCLFVYAINDILFPFVFGLLVAYFFDPLVGRFEKIGIKRGLASAFIILSFGIFLIGLVAIVTPIITEQGQQLIKKLPSYYSQAQITVLPYIENQIAKISPKIAHEAKLEAQKQVDFSLVQQKISAFIGGVLNSGSWLFNLLSLIFITPIVSFYTLRDWPAFKNKIDELLPRQHGKIIRTQLKKIDATVSAYLRGQLNVCFILGSFYAVALTIVGLDFGILIGFCAGLLSFIPYVGSAISVVVGGSIAYFQFNGDTTSIATIAAIFVFGQVVEGNFITPKIVGNKVGVHPAWLIFGMLAGGSLFGFIGVVLSVPVTAIINVLIQFTVEQYEASGYYENQEKPKRPQKKVVKK